MTKTFDPGAIHRLAYDQTEGRGPGVVFLGGYASDKEGTKALYLEDWAQRRGRAFLRFDYSGHGDSDGAFEDGTIGSWRDDAVAIIGSLTTGPQILVGSSMGGWISLLIARDYPELVAGLVTVAAAPDFTIELEAGLSDMERTALDRDGRIERPSDYGPEPQVFTAGLIRDGERQQVLDRPLTLDIPVRFLQGTADADVAPRVATRLLDHATGPDMRLTMVKGADHRFSGKDELALLVQAVEDVSARVRA